MSGFLLSSLERLFVTTFGIVFCVVLPVLVTWSAPISTCTFSRAAGQVRVVVTNHLLLVVPFRTTTIKPVLASGGETHEGETYVEVTNYSGRSRRQTQRTEATGYLVLSNQSEKIRVPISPVNLAQAQQRVEQFLAAGEPDALRLRAIANWKVSVVAGLPLSMLTLLYMIFLIWKAVQLPVSASRRRELAASR